MAMRKHGKQGTNRRRRGILSPYLLVSLSPCLFVFLLLGLKLPQAPDSERLLEEGHAAFARGDYAAAAELYEQAEIYSTEPTRVAFYLAGAKYHLAVKTEGTSPELLEAEKLYRCCLAPSDPLRPRALYGLGNCLLHKAGGRDAAGLRTAIACYDQCLQSASDDEQLIANARHNREKARLLLLQFQPPANGSQSDAPPDDEHLQPPRQDPHRPMPVPIGQEGHEGDADAQPIDGAVKPEDGTAAAKNNEPPSPGKGNLDPVPDEVDVPPLSPHDAAEHLEMAAKKVLHERQTFHRRGERASDTRVKDW
jgi:tetratricopeptide (TPR) repeat protein